jgi:hypothetical protein
VQKTKKLEATNSIISFEISLFPSYVGMHSITRGYKFFSLKNTHANNANSVTNNSKTKYVKPVGFEPIIFCFRWMRFHLALQEAGSEDIFFLNGSGLSTFVAFKELDFVCQI